jgi:hypothetical protein
MWKADEDIESYCKLAENASTNRLYSVMVSTSDSDSGNPSSIPGTTSLFLQFLSTSPFLLPIPSLLFSHALSSLLIVLFILRFLSFFQLPTKTLEVHQHPVKKPQLSPPMQYFVILCSYQSGVSFGLPPTVSMAKGHLKALQYIAVDLCPALSDTATCMLEHRVNIALALPHHILH